jgi:hypothetical protein
MAGARLGASHGQRLKPAALRTVIVAVGSSRSSTWPPREATRLKDARYISICFHGGPMTTPEVMF